MQAYQKVYVFLLLLNANFIVHAMHNDAEQQTKQLISMHKKIQKILDMASLSIPKRNFYMNALHEKAIELKNKITKCPHANPAVIMQATRLAGEAITTYQDNHDIIRDVNTYMKILCARAEQPQKSIEFAVEHAENFCHSPPKYSSYDCAYKRQAIGTQDVKAALIQGQVGAVHGFFNQYPEAITQSDQTDSSPLTLALGEGNSAILEFLLQKISLNRQWMNQMYVPCCLIFTQLFADSSVEAIIKKQADIRNVWLINGQNHNPWIFAFCKAHQTHVQKSPLTLRYNGAYALIIGKHLMKMRARNKQWQELTPKKIAKFFAEEKEYQKKLPAEFGKAVYKKMPQDIEDLCLSYLIAKTPCLTQLEGN